MWEGPATVGSPVPGASGPELPKKMLVKLKPESKPASAFLHGCCLEPHPQVSALTSIGDVTWKCEPNKLFLPNLLLAIVFHHSYRLRVERHLSPSAGPGMGQVTSQSRWDLKGGAPSQGRSI